MKINITILNLLFLFLTSIILVSCTSSPLEEEISVSEVELNELNQKKNTNKSSFLNKDTDRPGNQG